MKIKMFLSSIMLFFLFDNFALAQYRIDGVTFSPSIQHRSFIKYGGLQSHDLNTGTIFVKIPLYTYQDNDFTIPFSLDYASNGYTPNVQSGVLGLGWYLNAGGCIIREVRGIPDNAEKGFLNAHFNQSSINWETIKENNRDNLVSGYTQFADGTETESDIYHFRFLNYSASFILGGNNTVYVYNSSHPKDEYKIDFSKLAQNNTITITTGNGYKYTFGGTFQNDLDKTVSNGSAYKQDYNLTWVLYHIATPNGRSVTYTYSALTPNDVYQPISYYFNKSYTWDVADWTDEYGYPNMHENEFKIAAYSQYDIKLKSVNIDNKVTVTFGYGEKARKERAKSPVDSSIAELNNTGRLFNIVVKARNSIKAINLAYQSNVNSSGNYAMLLNSIAILPNNEQYTFNYYDSSAIFPYHGTTQIDHWGYYRNSSEASAPLLLPTVSCDPNNAEIVGSSNRESNFDGARFGMLQKIIYPTRGYTTFEYEGNSYTLKVDRNNLTQWLPAIVAKNIGGFNYNNAQAYPAGGVRLKKITNYAPQSTSITTEYLYSDKTGNQSGILLYYPRYLNGVVTKHDSLNISVYRRIVEREASNFINEYVDRRHIEYPSVLAKHSDNSFVEYKFTNYATAPDQLSVISLSKALSNGYQITALSPATPYQYDTQVPSNNHLRGMLSEKVLNNSSGVCVRKYVYDYNYLVQAIPYTSIHKTAANVYLYNRNINDKFQTQESQIDYFGVDSIVKQTHYSYNNSGRLISKMNNNNGKNIESITYYPNTLSGSPFQNISKESTNWEYLINNKLNYPIGELIYSDGKVVSGKIYYYTLLTNENRGQYCALSKVGQLKTIGISPNAINEDSFELKFKNDVFAGAGQLVQRTDSNNGITSYIWESTGTCILAEISGVPFEVVKQTLGTFSNGIFNRPSLTPENESKLRSIPNALVRTFTYDDPFIGVQSITDQNGKKTTFEYYAPGMPRKILDHNGAVIEEYEYNFSKN